MAGVGGMHEECRRAGRGERRRDLARDVAGFAHAGHDDAAARVADRFNGGDETGRRVPSHMAAASAATPSRFRIERAQRRGDGGFAAGFGSLASDALIFARVPNH